jgi:hypothetical protein
MNDKSLMKDTMGRPLTQGLFLEFAYDTKFAIFTFNDEDKEYEGKIYTSLKKQFLSCEDPTEYEFATKYLLGWRHWLRMNENKQLKEEFDVWREEFEISVLIAELAMSSWPTLTEWITSWSSSNENHRSKEEY